MPPTREPPAIVVVGSYVTDLTCITPHLPKPGETVFGGPFRSGPGGKGANQATAARRCGAAVALVSRLGNDGLARQARQFWDGIGLDHRHVGTDPVLPTGAALITVDEKTCENAIVVAPGACTNLGALGVDAAAAEIATCRVLLTQLETDLPATRRALELGRAAGVRTILNPAPWRAVEASLFSLVDICTPNEHELAAATGLPTDTEAACAAAAQSLRRAGPACVVATRGAAGAMIVDDAGVRCLAPPRVQVVDTTGAGDAFNGGLACALAEGLAIDAAVRFANAVAALAVTAFGTAPAMPDRAAVDRLLSEQP